MCQVKRPWIPGSWLVGVGTWKVVRLVGLVVVDIVGCVREVEVDL